MTLGVCPFVDRAAPQPATSEAEPVSTFGPVFPVGFMGAPRQESLATIAEGGFNTVHEFRGIQEIDDAERYLDEAASLGLYVIQNMPWCRAPMASGAPCPGVDVWGEDEWALFISQLGGHPNLAAWFLPDEIDDYATAADLYTWVRRYDPVGHPVYGNPGTLQVERIAEFTAFSDFVWAACYPEYEDEPRALVTYGMRVDATACQGTDTRWGAILQFFDSADFGLEGGYPTPRELRCDSYQAIIGGAKGLWYYAYERGKDLDGLLEGVSTVADEIAGTGGLDEVIASADVLQTITKTVLSGPTQTPRVAWSHVYDSIQTLQKLHRGIYLFATNVATDTVVVRFGNLPAQIEEAEVLFEGRTLPVTNRGFTDTFAADDVHVYRMDGAEVYFPTIVRRSAK